MTSIRTEMSRGVDSVATPPMRIGFLVKTFPRLSETFILNEILGLEKLGWTLHIFSLKRPTEEPMHPAVAEVKAQVSYIPTLLAANSIGDPFRVVAAHLRLFATRPLKYLSVVRRYFRETKKTRLKEFLQAGCLAVSMERASIQYLHAHFANTPTAVAELVHWLTGIPFSFTAHAKDIYTSNPADLTRRIQTATSVLTCTGFNADHLRSIAGAGASIYLAYHGIDTRRFASVKRTYKTRCEDELPLVLSVGRFCEKKGLDDLIRSCAILRGRGVRFRCALIGYGPLERDLKELRKALDLEACIDMPGRLAQPEVIEYYQKANVFALPCLVTDSGDRDGIPNVLFEAMAAGVPVVTTNVSGITELVLHGETGWVAGPRQPDMLATFIEYALTHPEESKKLADNARRRVEQEFTLEVSSMRVHECLTRATVKGKFEPGYASLRHGLSRERSR